MHAYVFWHSPAVGTDPQLYEQRLIDFHKTFAAHAPPGFHSSLIFRIENAPWINSGLASYEDWYLLENSAALDAINDAAISGPRKEPHDGIASLAASGAAGLYRLKSGDLDAMKSARHATWFSKPPISYQQFFEQLAPISEAPQTNLWVRQMVLSAAPEFCLRTVEKPQLSPTIKFTHCPVEGIHPT
jgi:hypothetical protein